MLMLEDDDVRAQVVAHILLLYVVVRTNCPSALIAHANAHVAVVQQQQLVHSS